MCTCYPVTLQSHIFLNLTIPKASPSNTLYFVTFMFIYIYSFINSYLFIYSLIQQVCTEYMLSSSYYVRC